ncbi:helix-turn-helix transcriptional regulator [Pseudomonas aeruginosa]|uniref:helix-turn-helix transcriptional regulator n=1 Tax=Pseudomonas aeruginosa TaxID=287 RepID=UPI003F6E3C0E
MNDKSGSSVGFEKRPVVAVLRLRRVVERLGISRSTIYDWMNPKSPVMTQRSRYQSNSLAAAAVGLWAGWSLTSVGGLILGRPSLGSVRRYEGISSGPAEGWMGISKFDSASAAEIGSGRGRGNYEISQGVNFLRCINGGFYRRARAF